MSTRITSALAVAVALVLVFALRVGGGREHSTRCLTEASRPADLQVRQRAGLGFPTDAASMAAARKPRVDADPRFPVPLTVAEELQMKRRMRLQNALGDLEEEVGAALDELGGMALEHVGDGSVVLYLGPGAREQKWKELVATKYRFPDKVRFERVGKSANELQSRADEIHADSTELKAAGFPVTGVGVNVQGAPRVVISLADCDRSDELAKRYPDVSFEQRRV